MKIFVAGGTGAIGRPLIAKLIAKGHAVVALIRFPEEAKALVERGIEPAIADVFDTDAVKTVVSRAQPEVVIQQLTALPKHYTREAMRAAAPLNTRLRLEGVPICWQRHKRRERGVTWGSRSHSGGFLVPDWQMKKHL